MLFFVRFILYINYFMAYTILKRFLLVENYSNWFVGTSDTTPGRRVVLSHFDCNFPKSRHRPILGWPIKDNFSVLSQHLKRDMHTSLHKNSLFLFITGKGVKKKNKQIKSIRTKLKLDYREGEYFYNSYWWSWLWKHFFE